MPACSSGLGKAQLLPLLPLFYRQFPEVDIQLLLEDRFASLIDEQVDVAIRVGHLPDSSYVARRLGDMQWLLCASPVYLQRRGTPQAPHDLRHHNCLLLPEHDPCYGYLAVSPR
ncbi:substrate binding domain-containing protein [Teredinibacter turnerae]|uniref:substrate binding domain-containing protein n=1 Tax=Teredinibacter turnerae TaxID=2426 RepID=UPI0003A0A75F|nr:substrate binding domain-containing protein [Teredinibacter turnerae]